MNPQNEGSIDIIFTMNRQADLLERQGDDISAKVMRTGASILSSQRDKQTKVTPLNDLSKEINDANSLWWCDRITGQRLDRNKGELLMLIVSEVAECMEGERKNLMDTHLTHRLMAEVELADILIRVFDYAGAYGYDLDGAMAEKRAYNERREDHQHEARLKADGKKW